MNSEIVGTQTIVSHLDLGGAWSTVGEGLRALGRAGCDVRFVVGAFGAKNASDVRYLALRGAPPRRGLLAWVALLVAGEGVERTALERAFPDGGSLLTALAACGVVAGEDEVRARGCLQPLGVRPQVFPWLLSDRFDCRAPDAVSAPDLSAWNVIGCLPPDVRGQRVLEVGAGAGAIAMVLAAAGAEVLATELHASSLALCRVNALLNGLAIATQAADLLDGIAGAFSLITFNAPLLRAAVAASADDGGWYASAAQGEDLAARLVAAARSRLRPDGELLLHAQLVPSLGAALAEWDTRSFVFARAVDGTAHALHVLRSGTTRHRIAETPLGRLLPVLARRVIEATWPADDALLAAAPWLELVERRRIGDAASGERTFGGRPITVDELALLESAAPQSGDASLVRALVDRGWLVDRRRAT